MTSGVLGPVCPQHGIAQGATVLVLSEAGEAAHQETGQSTSQQAETDGEPPALCPDTALHSCCDELVTVTALDLDLRWLFSRIRIYLGNICHWKCH